jgi:hypothetical protein
MPRTSPCFQRFPPALRPRFSDALAASGSRPWRRRAPRRGGAGAAAAIELAIETIMARDWIGTPPEDPYWSDDGKLGLLFVSAAPAARSSTSTASTWRAAAASASSRRTSSARWTPPAAPGRATASSRRSSARATSSSRRPAAAPPAADPHRRQRERAAGPRRPAEGRLPARRRLSRHRSRERARLDPRRAAERARTRTSPPSHGLSRPPSSTAPLRRPRRARRLGRRSSWPRIGPGGLPIRRARRRRSISARSARSCAPSSRPPAPPAGRPGPRAVPATGRVRRAPRTAARSDSMPVFITESGYVEVKKIRPKVGTGSPESPTLLLLDLVRQTQVALDLGTACPASPTILWPSCAGERPKPPRQPHQAERCAHGAAVTSGTAKAPPKAATGPSGLVSPTRCGTRTAAGSPCSSSRRTTRIAGSRSSFPRQPPASARRIHGSSGRSRSRSARERPRLARLALHRLRLDEGRARALVSLRELWVLAPLRSGCRGRAARPDPGAVRGRSAALARDGQELLRLRQPRRRRASTRPTACASTPRRSSR